MSLSTSNETLKTQDIKSVKTTRAAILVELNKSLVVADIELPKELSFGQVLVKVCYSGICGAQINEIEGAKGPDKFLPHLLGHEGSGIVEAVGPGVKTVAVGDHVVMHWRPSDGLQCEPPKYKWGERTVNAGWVTTFNERAVVSENRLTAIPKDFDLKLAPLFGCAVTTAMGVINNDAQVKIGQSVVVFGVGGVGLNIVQAAQMVSAGEIIAIDLHDSKLDLAKQFGATQTFNAKTTKDLNARIQQVVGGKGADVVIDTTGNARVIEQAYELTHADGKTILVGVPRKGDNVSIYTLPLHFKKILKGSHGGSVDPHIEIPRLIRLYGQGKLKLDGLITHEFRLAEINRALETMRSGQMGRCIIAMES
ncbi:MAG TPA: zinc-binding dehydrogenase [Candidatus Omnitrophota bacterium]|nr:zinc-binding dehydrogenase [Candidatus Omnitrophota bacterium]